MEKEKWRLLLPLIGLLLTGGVTAKSPVPIDQAKSRMIQESINRYQGSCPCPYSVMSNGRKCGKRSAYSRPGGFAPICYARDISDNEAKKYLSK